MVEVKMTITAKHHRVVALEPIGVDDASATHSFNREVKKSAVFNVFNHFDPVTLQYAENRDFPGSPTATFALASATEVALVYLDDSAEKLGTVGGVGNNGRAYLR